MTRKYEQLSNLRLKTEIQNAITGAREFDKKDDREKAWGLYFDLLKEREIREVNERLN